MYWSVIGAFVAFEYVAEWLVSWLPFYWEIKTAFLLFLSLPQIQGSTYIYNSYIQPFFVKNETDLDAGIVSAQQNTLSFVQSRLNSLWEVIWSLLNKTPASGQRPASGLSGPASSLSLESVMGLWDAYAPSVMSMLQPSVHPTAHAATPVGTPPVERRTPQPYNTDSGYFPLHAEPNSRTQ